MSAFKALWSGDAGAMADRMRFHHKSAREIYPIAEPGEAPFDVGEHER